MLRNHVSVMIAGGMMLLAAGCGGSSRAYTPTASSARQGLEAALTAWRNGEKPDALAKASPAVHVMDDQWQAGQALERFEILEELPGESEIERRFSVRLALKKPKGETVVRYIILGREPLWVYSEDAYKRFLNMDNNPQPKPTATRPRGR